MMAVKPAALGEIPEVAERGGWRRAVFEFCRARPLGAIGAVVVLINILVGLGAPLIAPYDPLAADYGPMASRAPPGPRRSPPRRAPGAPPPPARPRARRAAAPVGPRQ